MPAADSRNRVLLDQKLESTLESVDLAEQRILILARQVGFAEEETFRFGYAVREAMVNAVVHGNRYSANKKVHFLVRRNSTSFEVRIRDEGGGFRLDLLADPLAEENLLNQSGRGLTLIRAFVDEFQVGPAEGGGTEAVLRKVLPPVPEPPEAVSQ
jgi:serine/threonine-protein kinase RsbW